MSVESMAIALHHSRATGTAKIVLLGIANHDGDGGAWPSVDTLAKYANVTRRNVMKALRRLEELREIHVVLQGGGSHSVADTHRPNLYKVTLRCPPSCDRSTNHRTSTSAPIPGLSTDLYTGGSDSTPGVAFDQEGGSLATPEPPINPTTQVKRTGDGTRACATCDHVNAHHDRLCDRCGSPLEVLT